MKSSDRAILIGLIVVGAFAAFWFLALAPKREEASELGDEISQLNADSRPRSRPSQPRARPRPTTRATSRRWSCSARPHPPTATPIAPCASSSTIAEQAKTDFELLQLGTAPAEAPAPAAETTTDESEAAAEASGEEAATATTTTTAAPATEAAASSLPIGAIRRLGRPRAACLRHEVPGRLLPDRRSLQGHRRHGRVARTPTWTSVAV